jgi:protein-S-isoprenylcysteine O-methyltransferase Ste14
MFTRALLAFLAFLVLPGVVAIAVPVTWLSVSSHTTLVHPFGLVPLGVGLFALLRCVRDFCFWGNGTLGPWAPARLVVVGLYRCTRNPIYIAIILMLLGWAVSFAFRGLFVYAIVVAVAFHLRVVLAEEPWLARMHGAVWTQYASRVPRWFW